MNNFNIKSNKVIGVVKKRGTHADIFIVGFQDNNYHFVGLTREESKSFFKDKGKAFAPNFAAKNEHRINELLCLSIKPAENYEEGFGKDMYIIDYDAKIYDYQNTRIYQLSASLSDVNRNHNAFIVNELETNNKYYKDNDRIYYFDKTTNDTGIAKYWNFNDDFKDKYIDLVCGYENDYFIIGDYIDEHNGYIDFFDDEKVVTYILNIIKHSNSLLPSLDELPKDIVKSLNIPDKMLQQRFDRFKDILSKYTLSYNNVIALSKNPLLSDSIIKSIQEYEDDYIRAFKAKHASDIVKLKQEYNKATNDFENKKSTLQLELQVEQDNISKLYKLEIESLKSDITEKKEEVSELENEIEKKSNELTKISLKLQQLEDNKSRLIEDYSIIKEVIGGNHSNHITNTERYHSIEDIKGSGELISEVKEFKDRIRCSLKINQNNLIGLFVKMRVLLLPDIVVIKSLIDAIGDYNLLSICVGANWKSYNDLYENGLDEMLFSCKMYPKKIHLMILQNMNLSYIPCYMQPINDIITGLRRNLPGNHGITGIPSNLWIIGTRTREEAMIIPKEYIKHYGCLSYNIDDNNESSESLESSETAKYISMDCIYKWQEELDMVTIESNYESYIDE